MSEASDERLRHFAECLGDPSRGEPLAPCDVTDRCGHGDCMLANAILAALNFGLLRACSRCLHEVCIALRQQRQGQIAAMCRVIFPEDKS